jgi:hypothetical protein
MMVVVVPAMMPVMAMPTMMPMMMPMPTDLGGLYLGTLLHRRGGAGIGQRQRLGALGWSGQDQQSADRSQSQKSHHVHVYSPLESSSVTRAARLGINRRRSADRKLCRRREQEMKTCAAEMNAGRALRFRLRPATLHETEG